MRMVTTDDTRSGDGDDNRRANRCPYCGNLVAIPSGAWPAIIMLTASALLWWLIGLGIGSATLLFG